MSGVSNYANNVPAPGAAAGARGLPQSSDPPKSTLDLSDFLQLMVAQFQNQSIDDTASTSDMLNQLVQMSVVQAITDITDTTIMTYAGSLVGKEVTVGEYKDGKLVETVGVVTGTGTYRGQQVVFVNGKSYYLSDIMAVGRLPEKEEPEKPGDGEDTDGGDNDDNTENTPEAR